MVENNSIFQTKKSKKKEKFLQIDKRKPGPLFSICGTNKKMSVSIFNSYHCDNEFGVLRFTETSKMHHSTVPRAKLDHVRRNLFGPVDRKECSR